MSNFTITAYNTTLPDANSTGSQPLAGEDFQDDDELPMHDYRDDPPAARKQEAFFTKQSEPPPSGNGCLVDPVIAASSDVDLGGIVANVI
ncbi:hypothetical protein OE88DRAFT_1739647 [Heliocybe sulcata]|uniref:Uncharacterized protein n=1 Tax=Heliocybe sulcata TaxID=5364 RepID=A0A5C3MLJ2_9AGAM|nr:hypothetical protein OE88DRAFT_1739647 [Heliocybe sulcata]